MAIVLKSASEAQKYLRKLASKNPSGLFITGVPGSGKGYVCNLLTKIDMRVFHLGDVSLNGELSPPDRWPQDVKDRFLSSEVVEGQSSYAPVVVGITEGATGVYIQPKYENWKVVMGLRARKARNPESKAIYQEAAEISKSAFLKMNANGLADLRKSFDTLTHVILDFVDDEIKHPFSERQYAKKPLLDE